MDVRRIPVSEARRGLFGRDVEHDPRSAVYGHGVMPRSALATTRWLRRIAVLDQLALGSCVGNATTGVLGTDRAAPGGGTLPGLVAVGGVPLDESFAVNFYSACTKADTFPGEWPPTDTGTSGLAAGKVLKTRGLASGYTHAFTSAQLATMLQSGPALVGLTWFESMFEPKPNGGVPMDQASGVAGGHELCFDGLEITGSDATHWRYWFTNSWGEGWGQSGQAFLVGADIDTQMTRKLQGDAVFPALVGATPPPPTPPTPDTGPTAAERALYASLQGLAATVDPWARERRLTA